MSKALKSKTKPLSPSELTKRGLYRKALGYFNKFVAAKPTNGSAGDLGAESGISADGITADEQREILQEINTLIAQKKTQITPELLLYHARHLGFFLPLLINLVAAGIVALAFFLLPVLFEKGFFERTDNNQNTILSAEGNIVEELKKQSAAEISQKEAELSHIQEKMGLLKKEKEVLDANFDEQVRQKEEELKSTMSRTLELEKEKLQKQGVSQEAMTQELTKLELQLKQSNLQAMDSYKSQIEAELTQKETMISQLGAQLSEGQQALTRVQQDFKAQISARENELKLKEEEINKRETALQARYQAEKKAIESELGDVSQQFAQYQNQQQQEQLAQSQILSFYSLIDTNLKEKNYDQAAVNLNALDEFLKRKDNALLPGIQERKPVELFLIGSLKEYIGLKQTNRKEKTNPDSGVIEKLETQIADLKKQLAELESNSLVMTTELTKFKNSNQTYLTVEEKRQQLEARLQELKKQFVSYLEKNKAGKTINQEEEYSLIISKLTLKKILTSTTVTSQYPELYQDMERYFNQLDEERLNWQSAAQGLLTVLNNLKGEAPAPDAQTLWSKYQQDNQQQLLQQYLQNLQTTFKTVRENLVKKLAGLNTDWGAYAKSHPASSPLSDQEMYDLVMAKLVVKKILSAEPYLTQNPDLYNNVEKYIALLEQEQTAWKLSYQEIVFLASRLNGEIDSAELKDHWSPFVQQQQKDVLLDFINSLLTLI